MWEGWGAEGEAAHACGGGAEGEAAHAHIIL